MEVEVRTLMVWNPLLYFELDGYLVPSFAGGVDNTVLNTGSGGDTIGSDDIGGIKFQRVKIIEGADGVNDGDISSANPLPVDVTDSATRDLGTVDIAAPLPAGTNNIGDVDVLTLPAIPAGTNNIGDVDVASGPTGASALQAQGAAAHDAVAAGNPVQMGTVASLDEPTAVADGDAVRLWADQLGRLVILQGHGDPEPPVTANGSASGVTVIAAPGAGVSLYIMKGSVHSSAAAEQLVSLRDGAAGTIRWTANLAADGGGSLFDFGSRIN